VLVQYRLKMPKKYKTTWQHLRSKHWHVLDYIITRQRDVTEVHVTRAMQGSGWLDAGLITDCWGPFCLCD